MAERTPSFAEWNLWLGRTVGALDDVELPRVLLESLRRAVRIDDGLFLVFWRRRQPHLLYVEVMTEYGEQINLYLRGAYLMDPFYRAAQRGIASGLYPVAALAGEDYANSAYAQLFHQPAGIVDEADFLTRVSNDAFLCLSLARRGEPFPAEDLETLCAIEPVVRAVLKQHWKRRPVEPDLASLDVHARVEAALQQFGRSVLTDREGEVIRLILSGHSTKSAADALGIAPDTVKLHRKHAYAKLNVGAQAELFSLFIDSLCCVGDDPTQDPLSTYLNTADTRRS